MSEKLHKIMARHGLGSRRHLEEIIAAGRVSVNGRTAALGMRLNGPAEISIDGQVVLTRTQTQPPPCRVMMYYKPEGEVTTLSDPQGRPTVMDRLPPPREGRWVYVGRLDLNSSGLLLLTTDGELAHALMHPSHAILRTYAARVFGEVTAALRRQLLTGVDLPDGRAAFESVTAVGGEGANRWYEVSLREGRHREVRRLFEALGLSVSRLIRIRYGSISLDPALSAGDYRELSAAEISSLRSCAGLPEPPREPREQEAAARRSHAGRGRTERPHSGAGGSRQRNHRGGHDRREHQDRRGLHAGRTSERRTGHDGRGAAGRQQRSGRSGSSRHHSGRPD